MILRNKAPARLPIEVLIAKHPHQSMSRMKEQPGLHPFVSIYEYISKILVTVT